MMVSPHDFRFQSGQPDYLLTASLQVSEQYGEAAGIPKDYLVPPEIIEGVMEVETGGDIDNCGSNCPWQGEPGKSAVWPMNVMPNGGEADYWEQVTGTSFEGTIPQNYPQDIFGNIEVGTLGLANDYQRTAEATGDETPSWYDVAMTYFTGDPNPDTASSRSDGYNTGSEYRSHVKNYITEQYGSDIANALDEGQWLKNDGGNIGYVNDVIKWGTGKVDKAKDAIGSVAKDVLNGLFDFVGKYIPRAGIAVVGLVLLALGLKTIIQ